MKIFNRAERYSLFAKIAPQSANPLLSIFQQSLHQGVFPERWKRASIMLLYNGKGKQSNAFSYRPISLCSCIGKLLEKIVKERIQQQIAAVRLFSYLQRYFSPDQSRLTNLVACGSLIANLVNAHKSLNIITFDLQRACDKVPYHLLLEALKGQ